jgi:hypothetical protein
MFNSTQAIPTFAGPFVLSVFSKLDTNAAPGGKTTYPVNLEMAKLVSVIRDIQCDPLVTAKTSMLSLYKLYPKLKAQSALLWTGRNPNWDFEKPLACAGITMFRDTPKSRTLKLNIGKMVLEFKC